VRARTRTKGTHGICPRNLPSIVGEIELVLLIRFNKTTGYQIPEDFVNRCGLRYDFKT
jgi:hypothetical protein